MNTHDELERELSAALRGRADRMADAPLSLQDVTGKARTIRRNRRVATGAGLLAAAAVIVPMAIFAGGDMVKRGNEEPMPITPVPTPVAEPVTLSPDAPVEEPPRIAWIDGRTIHLPDGTSITPQRSYMSVHLVGGEVLALWNDDDTGFKELHRLDSTGAVVDSTPLAGDSVVSNSDGSVIAYHRPDGGLELRTSEGTRTIDVDLGQAQLLAVSGDSTCAEGCSVYFNRPWPEEGAAMVDLAGKVTAVAPGALSVRDAHDGLVSALTSADDLELRYCFAIYAAGDKTHETCERGYETFSPDGEWLMTSDTYLDGVGQGTVGILDPQTGTVQVTYDAGEGVINYRTWEDDTHLLAVHYSFAEGVWRLYRLGLDGSVEQAAEPVERPDTDGSPFKLVER